MPLTLYSMQSEIKNECIENVRSHKKQKSKKYYTLLHTNMLLKRNVTILRSLLISEKLKNAKLRKQLQHTHSYDEYKILTYNNISQFPVKMQTDYTSCGYHSLINAYIITHILIKNIINDAYNFLVKCVQPTLNYILSLNNPSSWTNYIIKTHSSTNTSGKNLDYIEMHNLISMISQKQLHPHTCTNTIEHANQDGYQTLISSLDCIERLNENPEQDKVDAKVLKDFITTHDKALILLTLGTMNAEYGMGNYGHWFTMVIKKDTAGIQYYLSDSLNINRVKDPFVLAIKNIIENN